MTDTIIKQDILEGNIDLANISSVIVDKNDNEQLNWLQAVGFVLSRWDDVIDTSINAQGCLLYNVFSVWDDLSKTVTAKWHYDFYEWAKAFTKRRAKEPAKTTIQNKITVYRDYSSENAVITAPPKVYIPKRDTNGNLIDEDLKTDDAWDLIENPNFDDVDFSKKLIARKALRDGNVDDEVWTIIFDPHSTVYELKQALNQVSEKKEKTDNLYLYFQDGIIYARNNGDSCGLLQILVEDEDEPVFKQGLEYLFRVLQLEMPDVLIIDQQKINEKE